MIFPQKITGIFPNIKMIDPIKLESIQIPLKLSLGLFSSHTSTFSKDLTSSFLKSAYIIMYKPFSKGDHIKVLNYEGKVDYMDLKYLKLKRKDKSEVYIPTSNLFSSIIEIIR